MKLTERERSILTALRDDGGAPRSPAFVASLIGDRRPTAGHSMRPTLFAMERKGLVKADYFRTHGSSALFAITDAGRAALSG